MAAYDALPPELRRWLASAALPWCPHAVHRAFRKALAGQCGDVTAALARLDIIEARLLARDTLAA